MASDNKGSFHSKVNRLLDNSSLHEAFRLLKSKIASNADPRLQDKLKNLEDTYKYMIHYMVEGYNDSERHTTTTDITEQLRMVNDALERSRIMVDSPDIYSSTRRFENIRKNTLSTRLADYMAVYSKSLLAVDTEARRPLIKETDDALSALFSYVWTMYGAPADEYRRLTSVIDDDNYPFEFKAQIISALLLGNLAYYDRNGFIALLDIYEADKDERLSARSLIAIILVLAAHPERIRHDHKLTARLTLWKDSIITYRRLREVLMSIIRSRDTQRISTKMQNEVLPELMKLRPEILDKLKNITKDSDVEMLDVNPEWEDILNKNGLGDKLKELTEMQMDGGDVMMMAFSNLKSYPFFNNVGNWFLPFTTEHSALQNSGINHITGFSFLLDMDGVMCDSDKYSFVLSLDQMPETQRQTMSQRLDEQMGQLKEAMAEKNLKSSLPKFDTEVTRYIRDIYRFFKLYSRKNDFNDPFARPLDFMNLPIIAELLDDDEIMNLVGEFYFKRGYYAEALPILLWQDKNNPADPLRWEKIGYCYNSLNNLEEAVAWYKKAELLNPDSPWLVKKLALCNRLLSRFDEASEYYNKALEYSPDNYSLQMSAGNCLLEAGNVKDALGHFYHADFIRPDRPGTFRAIAWGELIARNFEKAIGYYGRVTTLPEASQSDWINMGHAYYLSGNLKKAVESYLTSVTRPGGSLKNFEDEIIGDTDMLVKGGGESHDIKLLVDKVKYELDK